MPRSARVTLKARAGLYFVAKEGMTLTMGDRVQGLALIDEERVAGALFNFCGFGFLLALDAEGPDKRLGRISMGGKDLGSAGLLFRGAKLNFKLGNYTSHGLKIKWH